MSERRVADCFLRKAARPEAVLAALNGYAPLGGAKFEAVGETFETRADGVRVVIRPIVRMRPLMNEVNRVGKRLDDLRKCSMVLTVDVVFDPSTFEGTTYVASSPRGEQVGPAVPWQAVGACEALNIGLAAHGAITYDFTAGFYPSI